ncbi:MAG: hypothetical protein FJ387_27080 [Verrucomicrobia bacterium]|nr:hypothetical protein [Verrucomicrobiota bacterium]
MLSTKKIAALTLALLAGAFLVITQTASSRGHAYKLEGAWTSSGGGILGNMTVAPADPSGRRATAKVNWVTVGPTVAWLQAQVDADAATDGNVVVEMISRDSAKYTQLLYWVKTGCPDEIKMIVIDSGTFTFTGPNRAVIQNAFAGYLPSRDANGDGLPDDLDNPPDLGPFPGSSVFTRIPMLP